MKKITFFLVTMLAFCWQGHAQFTESFDAEIPATWTVVDVDGGDTWIHSTAQSYAGGGSARIQWDSNAHDDYLISPQFTVTANVSDRISIWAASYLGYIESFEVLLSTTGVAPGDFSVSLGDELASTDAPVFEQFSYDLSAYDGTPIYIAIKATGADQFYLYVDEFVNDAAPTCTTTVVDSSTEVDDCGNSQFSVNVVVSSVGDGTNITDGLGGSFPVVAGTVTAGPYTNGDTVTLTVEHSDPACNFSLGDFSTGCTLPGEVCDNAVTLTPGTPQAGATTTGAGSLSDSNTAPNVNPCSTNYNDLEYWFEYTAIETGETLDITVSDLTNTYYGVFVLDNCPDSSPTCVASDTNSSSSADLALTTPALTAGVTYYIVVTDWIQGPTTFTMNSTVNAAPTCFEVTNLDVTVLPGDTSATLTWDVEGSATSGYNWAVMNEFDDPELDAPVASGSTAAGVTTDLASGLTAGNDYDFYVQSNCDTNGLSTWAGPVNFTSTAPPANDECADAIALTVNPDYECGTVTSGTVAGATDSGVSGSGCFGTDDDDVWYSFEATTTAHRVSLLNVSGSVTDMYHAVFDAGAGCGSLGSAIVCSDGNTSNLTGLTIGNIYYVQVYTYTSTSGQDTTFDICVGTPPPPPANDTCASAEVAPVGLGSCGTSVTGHNVGATDSGVAQAGCATATYSGGDVWYTFNMPAGETEIEYNRSASVFSTTQVELYSGTCGALVEVDCTTAASYSFTGLTSGATYFLRLYDWGNNDFGSFTFCLNTPPTCPVPTGLGATNITTMSADLGWTENGTATEWDIEWGTNGFTPTGTPNIENTSNPHPLGGLTASTSYDFYVRADCAGGDTNTWAGPYTFATADPPPACGGNFYDDGGNAANYSNSANITTTICPDVPGDAVNVTFTFFSTENNGSTGCYDGLTIHDGPDASAPTINPTTGTIWCWDRDDATPNGTGDLQGMTISSTDASGCLTFVFTSDSSVSREGWEATVGCAPLSLEDYGLTGFTYFPNPVNNTLSLRGVKDIQNVAVYNMLGQEVLRTAPNTVNSDLDMSGLQSGTYFVKVMIENTTKTIKVIKK